MTPPRSGPRLLARRAPGRKRVRGRTESPEADGRFEAGPGFVRHLGGAPRSDPAGLPRDRARTRPGDCMSVPRMGGAIGALLGKPKRLLGAMRSRRQRGRPGIGAGRTVVRGIGAEGRPRPCRRPARWALSRAPGGRDRPPPAPRPRPRSRGAPRQWARAARPPPRGRAASSSSGAIAAASAAASPGGTSAPVSPSRRRSGKAPTVVATTGTPLAIASSGVSPNPSQRWGAA